MRSFDQLEKECGRTLVSTDEGGSGILLIDRSDTHLSITTPEMLREGGGIEGWFDLHLRSSSGESILLHNALFQSQSMRASHRPDYESTIYPNLVAFSAEALTAEGKAHRISFTTRSLGDFFNYEVVEWQSLRGASDTLLEALEQVRTLEKTYSRTYEFFSPKSLYLVHELPPVLQFRVEDRTYQIEIGTFSGLHWNAARVSAWPIASIHFDKPVSISEALDHVWEWRRFFVQLAMEPLPFEAITLGSTQAEDTDSASADLYIPGLKEKVPQKNQAFAFYAGLVPHGAWKDRARFADVMKGWLERLPKRRMFRAKLDQVVCSMQDSIELDHILALAAGLESLDEFDRTIYANSDIDVLAEGACAAAEAARLDVDPDRVRGVLGLLRKQNLRRRLEALWSANASVVGTCDGAKLIKYAYGYRNSSAHPSGSATALPRHLFAVVQALASLCVLWDLTSSGLDAAEAARRTNARRILKHALAEIERT